MSTQQEALWRGAFGTDYISRNKSNAITASAFAFLSRCLAKAQGIRSVVELGANIGINLDALRLLYPEATQTAVEINADACKVLKKDAKRDVKCESLLEFDAPGRQWDLVLVKGVLIHIAPADLHKAYAVIDKCARRYVLLCEYYNPTPVAVDYRGVRDALWKRDFAGEFMDAHEGWELCDYGFVYHRDAQPQDDICWFLMGAR